MLFLLLLQLFPQNYDHTVLFFPCPSPFTCCKQTLILPLSAEMYFSYNYDINILKRRYIESKVTDMDETRNHWPSVHSEGLEYSSQT